MVIFLVGTIFFVVDTIFDFTNLKDKTQGRALDGEAVILRAECKLGHPQG